MPTKLTPKANEQSTYVIAAAFTDENGDPVTPDTMTWTLTDSVGNVINARENVVIASLGTTATIVLHGDDLVIEAYGEKRVLTFEGTYTSDLSVDPLEYTDWCTFCMNDGAALE